MNPISRICPVTDAEAARMVRPEIIADLADQIMADQLAGQLVPDQNVPQAGAGWSSPTGRPRRPGGQRPPHGQRPPRGQRHPRGPRGPRGQRGPIGQRRPVTVRRRLLIGLPAAAVAAAVLLVVTSLGRPGQHVGPVGIGPPSAQALSFTRHGGYIYVIVRNPLADQKKCSAEFRAHHLDITLSLIPASPSLVGTLVAESGSGNSSALATITAKGKCFTGGGGNVCPVGVKVPVGFRGQASLYFGRAARPGERYETTAPATARGEVMHGMHFVGKTVATVLAMLAGRHVTVPVFHYSTATGIGELLRPSQVRRTWYVYDADPWALRQVMLWVGSTRTPPKPQPPQRVGSSPAPVPVPGIR